MNHKILFQVVFNLLVWKMVDSHLIEKDDIILEWSLFSDIMFGNNKLVDFFRCSNLP